MSVHILDAMSREDFEEVLAIRDRRSGLRGFLALHDTTAGPAFGGIRRWRYGNEKQALLDCLRLSRAMTWKCALAGVPGGGGKAVVLDAPEVDLDAGYAHLGRVVERMGGRFYTGPDVGTGRDHLAAVASETSYVTRPGDEGPGDLPGATAEGVFAGIAATLRHLDGEERFAERTVVIQGLGALGFGVARRLCERGARVLGSDIDAKRVERARNELGVEPVEPSREVEVECDVFSPCALGGVVHDLTVSRLRCRAVAGGANNVLARTRHGDRLHDRGILFAPDLVISAGALLLGTAFHLEQRRMGFDEIRDRIGRVCARVLRLSDERGMPPARVAHEEAERVLRERREEAEREPALNP